MVMSISMVKEYSLSEWACVSLDDKCLNEPFLIKGICVTWPAYKELTFSYLNVVAGCAVVEVSRRKVHLAKRKMLFSEYLAYCMNTDENDPFYLSDWQYDKIVPNLRAMIDVPDVFVNWFDQLPVEFGPDWKWLFIGPKNTGSGLHLDVMNSSAWNALLRGSKTWTLYPPCHSTTIHLRDGDRSPPMPECGASDELIAHQNAGDIMFTPSGWAHSVCNDAPTIALTHNFVNRSNWKIVLEQLEVRGHYLWSHVLRRLSMTSK